MIAKYNRKLILTESNTVFYMLRFGANVSTFFGNIIASQRLVENLGSL